MKLLEKLEYMTLGVFAVSVFSIGRPDINGLSAYFQQLYTEPVEIYLQSFVPAWIIILPVLALICLVYGKTVEYNAQYMLWVVGAILALDILLLLKFMPRAENAALSLGASILKLGINALTVFAIAFAYSCWGSRFGLTRFFRVRLFRSNKAHMDDPNACKRKYLMATFLCALSAILMIFSYTIMSCTNWNITLIILRIFSPILLLLGVLKAGNLELIEKE